VSAKRSAALRWAAGLPVEAIVARSDVPTLPRGRSMTFEARWRAVTMARLYSRCGWTFQRIGAHFGVGQERARQLVRLTSYRGERGGGEVKGEAHSLAGKRRESRPSGTTARMLPCSESE
jgi:hypothetical protein